MVKLEMNNSATTTESSTSESKVVQKQVKQKILQASQEEALFVQTSQALQSKMEKVEQQLSTSMNGYHIGYHHKNQIQNQLNNQLPPKCPIIEDTPQPPQQIKNGGQQQLESPKKPDDNNLASTYFQEKYGQQNGVSSNGNNSHTVQNFEKQNQQPQNYRSQSVGYNGTRTRSNTQTPERDVRSSSQAPSNNSSGSRRPSFSYLSLISEKGFPHRTQPIGDPQTSRRNSNLGSQDHLNNFAKPNLMVRSNPIGLAEPSVKRDGYAVGKDGTYYRSSDHLSSNRASRQGSVSQTPDREILQQRRSSTSSTSSGTGIRVGGGLIDTGKPVVQSFLPFGSTNAKKGPNYVIKKGNRSRSQSRPPPANTSTIQQNTSNTATNKIVTSSSTNVTNVTKIEQKSTLNTQVVTTEEKRLSSAISFNELDVALKKVAKEQEEVNVEVTLPRKGTRRARSLSRNNTETLPDENVTISLPNSQRGSRQPSMDRDLKRSSRSASMEIFTGVYEIKVPMGGKKTSSSKATVNELHTDTIRLKSGNESETTQVTFKAPQATNALDESLAKKSNNEASNSGGELLMQQKNVLLTAKQQENNLAKSTTTTITKAEKNEQEQQQKMIESSSVMSSMQMTHQTQESTFSTSSITTNSATSTSSSMQIQNEMVTNGGKFNITNGLKKTASHHSSQEDVRIRSRQISGCQNSSQTLAATKRSRHSSNTTNGSVVGCALKGLDAALDALSKEQKAQEAVASKYQSKTKIVTSENSDGVTSVTVSLPSSRQASRLTSRRGSIDLGQCPPGKPRSRRNSIDLYTADYNIKLVCDKANESQKMNMMQRSSSHIRIDDIANSKLKLCPRCHSPHCSLDQCTEYGNLLCPRCLQWEHWEDSCPYNDEPNIAQCPICGEFGHLPIVHEATDFRQRRAIVDTLGWQPFQSWFYENEFRSWWQLNGLVGVPLYRIYKRKNDWKSGGPIEPATDPNDINNESLAGVVGEGKSTLSIVEKAAALAEKYSTQYSIKRDDSTDELLKSVHAQREARKKQLAEQTNRLNNNQESRESTPEHLKKYAGSANLESCATSSKRLRTFSETLKLLDDDILDELDVK